MTDKQNFHSLAQQLIDAGRFIDSQGWVPATSGNFSARLHGGNIAITVSGKHKGHLQPDDIMLIDAAANSLDGKKPSAETHLHTAIYQRFPEAHAVLHPHSPNAILVSKLFDKEIVLAGYELLKAFNGITTHDRSITVPIFANDQDIPRLAKQVDDYMASHDPIVAYIIAGHGLYTWASSVPETVRYLEALDHLFNYELRLQGIKP
jgi:methylthioribulose-1-phosphate dehydratase